MDIQQALKAVDELYVELSEYDTQAVNVLQGFAEDRLGVCKLVVKDNNFYAGCNGKQTTYSVEFSYCRYCGKELEV